jgi:hypothetical protein
MCPKGSPLMDKQTCDVESERLAARNQGETCYTAKPVKMQHSFSYSMSHWIVNTVTGNYSQIHNLSNCNTVIESAIITLWSIWWF